MTIFLNPEVRSGLGEDTFWTHFAREFPDSTFDLPASGELLPTDVLLQYSTLGPPNVIGGIHVALCFELFHEMRRKLGEPFADVIQRIEACARACHRRVIASEITRPDYEPFGPVDCLPIGVDTDLFRRRSHAERVMLRERYGIPQDSRVAFWCGTNHPMKGYDRLVDWAANSERQLGEFGVPDRGIVLIVVWKSNHERGKAKITGAHEFTHVPQEQLAELMNCADFFLSTSRLRPFYMVEWEAMAAGLPVVNVGEQDKDFKPAENPRLNVLSMNWSRSQSVGVWRRYIDRLVEKAKIVA